MRSYNKALVGLLNRSVARRNPFEGDYWVPGSRWLHCRSTVFVLLETF